MKTEKQIRQEFAKKGQEAMIKKYSKEVRAEWGRKGVEIREKKRKLKFDNIADSVVEL